MGGWTTPGGDEFDENEVLDQHQVLVSQVDTYDLTSDTWELEARVPTPRFHSGAAIVKDKLYVVGGLTASARRRQTAIQGKFLFKRQSQSWGHQNLYWTLLNVIFNGALKTNKGLL